MRVPISISQTPGRATAPPTVTRVEPGAEGPLDFVCAGVAVGLGAGAVVGGARVGDGAARPGPELLLREPAAGEADALA